MVFCEAAVHCHEVLLHVDTRDFALALRIEAWEKKYIYIYMEKQGREGEDYTRGKWDLGAVAMRCSSWRFTFPHLLCHLVNLHGEGEEVLPLLFRLDSALGFHFLLRSQEI